MNLELHWQDLMVRLVVSVFIETVNQFNLEDNGLGSWSVNIQPMSPLSFFTNWTKHPMYFDFHLCQCVKKSGKWPVYNYKETSLQREMKTNLVSNILVIYSSGTVSE